MRRVEDVVGLVPALVFCGLGVRAQDALVMRAEAERIAIVAGEPLFVRVQLTNWTKAKVMIQSDRNGFRRITTTPDGSAIVSTVPEPPRDGIVFFQEIAPGAEGVFRFIAPETSRFITPGEYRMTVECASALASAEVRFVVKAYNEAELRERAAEVLDIAINSVGEEQMLNEEGLETINPASVAKPFVCEAATRNRSAFLATQKLVEYADADSIDCLVRIFAHSRALQREIIEPGLTGLMDRTKDGAVHQKLERALNGM